MFRRIRAVVDHSHLALSEPRDMVPGRSGMASLSRVLIDVLASMWGVSWQQRGLSGDGRAV